MLGGDSGKDLSPGRAKVAGRQFCPSLQSFKPVCDHGTTLRWKALQIKTVEEKDLGYGHLDDFVELLLVEPHGAVDCFPHAHSCRNISYFMFLLFQVSEAPFLMGTGAWPLPSHGSLGLKAPAAEGACPTTWDLSSRLRRYLCLFSYVSFFFLQ